MDHFKAWRKSNGKLVLSADEVHIWRAFLDQAQERIWALSQVLSPDERNRAERFRFQKDRTRFSVGRAVLRVIIGLYLGVEPKSLRFRYNPYGKPALDAPFGKGRLNFNVAHAEDVALYALVSERAVGVDIERLGRGLVEEERIVEKHFSPSEVARFKSLPGELQREAFLNGWTRKEACMKARGEGLSMPLDTFEVSLAPGKPARLMSVNGNSGEASRWTLLEIHPGVGYVGAVATDQNPVKPVFWQWKP